MKPQSRLAKVTEINVKSKIKAKKVTVTGWYFAEERVSIDKNTNVLSISLGIFRKPGMAGMDVITDFVKEINLTFPHKGSWKIQCNKQEIDVKVR
jgi:hypothetical protein